MEDRIISILLSTDLQIQCPAFRFFVYFLFIHKSKPSKGQGHLRFKVKHTNMMLKCMQNALDNVASAYTPFLMLYKKHKFKLESLTYFYIVKFIYNNCHLEDEKGTYFYRQINAILGTHNISKVPCLVNLTIILSCIYFLKLTVVNSDTWRTNGH